MKVMYKGRGKGDIQGIKIRNPEDENEKFYFLPGQTVEVPELMGQKLLDMNEFTKSKKVIKHGLSSK